MTETMPRKAERDPTPVAMFNSRYILTGTFGSIKEVSKITGAVRQSIIKAVYGDTISVKGCYLRPIPDSVIVDTDDLNTLTLFEFDEMAKIPDRKIYKSTRMGRRSDIIMESQHPRNTN
jgi:hypothetical protein